jgi:hypothetical protein
MIPLMDGFEGHGAGVKKENIIGHEVLEGNNE